MIEYHNIAADRYILAGHGSFQHCPETDADIIFTTLQTTEGLLPDCNTCRRKGGSLKRAVADRNILATGGIVLQGARADCRIKIPGPILACSCAKGCTAGIWERVRGTGPVTKCGVGIGRVDLPREL